MYSHVTRICSPSVSGSALCCVTQHIPRELRWFSNATKKMEIALDAMAKIGRDQNQLLVVSITASVILSLHVYGND
jgi:hypothetical protein